MDENLLASKGIYPSESTVGYVDRFCLHIGKRATLLHQEQSRVYGVVMKINSKEVDALYHDPSVADYVAEPVVVNVPGEGQVSAACYNLPTASTTGANPEYASDLLALATELGLPDSYLANIRKAASA